MNGRTSRPGGPTDYLESNAFLAVVADDDDLAREILAGLSDSELRSLAKDAKHLRRLCAQELTERVLGSSVGLTTE
jgi:hypothetical protein